MHRKQHVHLYVFVFIIRRKRGRFCVDNDGNSASGSIGQSEVPPAQSECSPKRQIRPVTKISTGLLAKCNHRRMIWNIVKCEMWNMKHDRICHDVWDMGYKILDMRCDMMWRLHDVIGSEMQRDLMSGAYIFFCICTVYTHIYTWIHKWYMHIEWDMCNVIYDSESWQVLNIYDASCMRYDIWYGAWNMCGRLQYWLLRSTGLAAGLVILQALIRRAVGSLPFSLSSMC